MVAGSNDDSGTSTAARKTLDARLVWLANVYEDDAAVPDAARNFFRRQIAQL